MLVQQNIIKEEQKDNNKFNKCDKNKTSNYNKRGNNRGRGNYKNQYNNNQYNVDKRDGKMVTITEDEDAADITTIITAVTIIIIITHATITNIQSDLFRETIKSRHSAGMDQA